MYVCIDLSKTVWPKMWKHKIGIIKNKINIWCLRLHLSWELNLLQDTLPSLCSLDPPCQHSCSLCYNVRTMQSHGACFQAHISCWISHISVSQRGCQEHVEVIEFSASCMFQSTCLASSRCSLFLSFSTISGYFAVFNIPRLNTNTSHSCSWVHFACF